MAIYHCSVQVISRNQGRSVVAASAYRSGSKMYNEYDGTTCDYTKKRWIKFTDIMLSPNAPAEYQDREKLWNAVEKAEKSSDAQLAREVELALPAELDIEQNKKLVKEYVQHAFVDVGMCADIAIHNPPKMNDLKQPIDADGYPVKKASDMLFYNPHAHILLTMRPIDEKGRWQAKSEKEYLCMRDGEEKGFTAAGFKRAQTQGWEKQYKYCVPDNPKNKMWLTPSEAEKRNMERVDRNPKATRYGRKNPVTEYWNQKERVEEWRKQWEQTVNRTFEVLKQDIRIDSRSFAERNIEQLPSIHMGVHATNMERRADRLSLEEKTGEDRKITRSDIAELNKEIKEYNGMWDKMKELQARIENKIRSICERIRAITYKITDNVRRMASQQVSEKNDKIQLANRIERVQSAKSQIEVENERSRKIISRLQEQKHGARFRGGKIERQIRQEQEKISKRQEYYENILSQCGFKSEGEIAALCKKTVAPVEDVSVSLTKETEVLKHEAEELMHVLPVETQQALKQDNNKAKAKLQEKSH